jgi:hypothetical protein
MLKRIASVLLTVFTANLMAAEVAAPRPPEDGVWMGTLGAQAVVACFKHERQGGSGKAYASYFYERYGKLIKLEPQPQSRSRWVEVGEKTSTGTWEFRVTAGDLLEGQWSGSTGASTERIRLKRFKRLGSSSSLSCEDLTPGSRFGAQKRQVSTKQTLPSGKQYRVLSVLDGAISTLELVGEGDGLAFLNERLANELRVGVTSYFGCPVSGELPAPASVTTKKPDYSSSISLLFWNERWVSLAQNSNGDCGGAYPFADINRSTWALRTGTPVNLWTWIAESRKPDALPDDDDYDYDFNYAAPEKLNRLIVAKAVKARLAFNPKEAQDVPNCLDALTTNTEYDITLGTKGLVFSHHFPHVVQACGDDIEIAYSRLLPFLNAEGKKQVAFLMASAQK